MRIPSWYSKIVSSVAPTAGLFAFLILLSEGSSLKYKWEKAGDISWSPKELKI